MNRGKTSCKVQCKLQRNYTYLTGFKRLASINVLWGGQVWIANKRIMSIEELLNNSFSTYFGLPWWPKVVNTLPVQEIQFLFVGQEDPWRRKWPPSSIAA